MSLPLKLTLISLPLITLTTAAPLASPAPSPTARGIGSFHFKAPTTKQWTSVAATAANAAGSGFGSQVMNWLNQPRLVKRAALPARSGSSSSSSASVSGSARSVSRRRHRHKRHGKKRHGRKQKKHHRHRRHRHPKPTSDETPASSTSDSSGSSGSDSYGGSDRSDSSKSITSNRSPTRDSATSSDTDKPAQDSSATSQRLVKRDAEPARPRGPVQQRWTPERKQQAGQKVVTALGTAASITGQFARGFVG